MTPHHHDPETFAWQAVRARLSLDPSAHMALDEAVGDCTYCWKRMALLLSVEMVVYSLIASLGGVYQNTKTGKTFGPAVDWGQGHARVGQDPARTAQRMIRVRGDSVTIAGAQTLAAAYRCALLGIRRRRADGLPARDLQELAQALYRAYMSPPRQEVVAATDTPAGLEGQQSCDDWVSTAEAAALLGLSRRSVQRMAAEARRLESIRVGRTYLLRLAPVLALAERRDHDRTNGLSRQLETAWRSTTGTTSGITGGTG